MLLNVAHNVAMIHLFDPRLEAMLYGELWPVAARKTDVEFGLLSNGGACETLKELNYRLGTNQVAFV